MRKVKKNWKFIQNNIMRMVAIVLAVSLGTAPMLTYAAEINKSSDQSHTLFLQMTENGSVVINQDKKSQKTIRLEKEDDTLFFNVYDIENELIDHKAVTDSSVYELTTTKAVQVKSVADDGYVLSDYSVYSGDSMDEKNRQDTDFKENISDYEYKLHMKDNTFLNVEFSEGDAAQASTSSNDISIENTNDNDILISDTDDFGISIQSANAASDNTNQCYVLAYEVNKVIDGTAPFDDDDSAGNDSSNENGIVRSFDTINYTLKYTTAIKDATQQGIDSTNVMVDFELPCDPKKAEFNVDTMTWLLDKKLLYQYADGSESATYDRTKEVVCQKLTGRRLLVNNESGNTVPGTGTLAIGINVNAAVTGDVIHPTFAIWMEGNADSEKKTVDVETKVSAAPKYDIEIKRNASANILGYYNPENKTATADYVNDGDLYGRLQYYTLSLRLQNDSASKGMKGIEFPDGSDITFDLRMSESVNDKDVSNEADYKPLFWDYAMDNGGKSKGVLGRPMSPLGQDIASYGCWTTNTPYNSGNNNGRCYNGGQLNLAVDESDANLLHATLSGYQMDMKDFDFPDRYAGATGSTITNNIGYISVCGFQLIGRFRTSVDAIENVGIVLQADNFHARSMSGIDVNSEVDKNNNISSVRITNYPSGSHSKRNFYYTENNQWARPSEWYAGDSYAYLGEKLRIDGQMIYTGDGYLKATNILQKFDDTAFDIPKGTTKYLTYGRSNGLTQIGHINTLFAAKPDKSGWKDDAEMNDTHEEQLIYFKSIDDLHDAGYTCVGVLYEVRDSKLYPNNAGGCLSIQTMVEMKDAAKSGQVCMTKNDVRSWKSGTDYTYLNTAYDESIKAYGIGDASWKSGTYADDYTKPTYRTDLNYAKAVYKDGTMVSGHWNSYQGGNSILIIGNKAAVSIKVADMTGDKSKSVYDLDAGERTAKFSVQPSTIITSLNSEVQTSDAKDNLKVSVILPKGLHFNETGVSLQPESVKENDDGTTTVIWKIDDVKVGSKIDPITFSTTIGEEGTVNDVQHNDAFNVVAKVTSDNDVRKVLAVNGNYAETEISVIKLAASAVTKRVLTPLVEKGEDIEYRLRYSNLSDTEALNAKLADVLPYNSDVRSSKFSGTYDVSDVKIDFSHASKTFENGTSKDDEDVFALFTSKDDAYRTKSELESMLASATGFEKFKKTDDAKVNSDKKTVSWNHLKLSDVTTLGLQLGKVYGHEYIDVYITLSPKDTSDSKQQPGDLYGNNFIQYADNQASVVTSNVVKAQVVKRKMSGVVWKDADADGIRNESEKLFKNAKISLYQTSKSKYDDTEDSSITVGDTKLYPAYDVYGRKVSAQTTDKNGAYSFDNLAAGTYFVCASDTDGYHLTEQDAGTDDEIDSDAELMGENIVIKDITLPEIANMTEWDYSSPHHDIGLVENTSISIQKYDIKERELLGGAKLAIYKSSDVVDGNVTEGAQPVISWNSEKGKPKEIKNQLLAGQTYALIETEAPDGYSIAEPITFTVESGKDVQVVKMLDDYKAYTVSIQKQNAKGLLLGGAKLKITGTETGTGKEISAIKWTSESGKVKELELKPGSYTLSEETAPAGYGLAEDVPFTVDENGVLYVNDEKVTAVTMVDDEMKAGSIHLKKYTSDGKKPLAGVEFSLKFVKSSLTDTVESSDYKRLLKVGETVSAVTDENGEISWSNLEQGEYEITEVKTVDGQQLLKDKISVTLPIQMTPDEVKQLSADTSKGEYNDAENMWYFYDATYEITNNAKFTMPKAGAMITVMRFMPLIVGMLVIVMIAGFGLRKKKCN